MSSTQLQEEREEIGRCRPDSSDARCESGTWVPKLDDRWVAHQTVRHGSNQPTRCRAQGAPDVGPSYAIIIYEEELQSRCSTICGSSLRLTLLS